MRVFLQGGRPRQTCRVTGEARLLPFVVLGSNLSSPALAGTIDDRVRAKMTADHPGNRRSSAVAPGQPGLWAVIWAECGPGLAWRLEDPIRSSSHPAAGRVGGSQITTFAHASRQRHIIILSKILKIDAQRTKWSRWEDPCPFPGVSSTVRSTWAPIIK